ncbi:laminin subunit alpha-2-like [Ruditapes philippinarum]|uniref:laminin subunit alpha-2-like n=1 Tax=Ruditapes philippinarum TaxID=129788 RepID=UPI00295A6BE5|nr:laminin subunit alpha-2-like [Ruditapes philippinarum]
MLVSEMISTIYVLLFTLIIYCEGRSSRRDRSICSGSSKIDIQTSYGVKIEPFDQSNVYIDSLSEPFEDRHSLRFEFKTTSGNGTLFYAVRRNDLQDMVSGSLHEGYPQFKIRCMSSFADFTIPVRVDDGEWHRVRFIRRHGKGIFLVDELEYFEQYYVSCGGFTSINFGNRNPAHYQSKSVKELQGKDGQMDGCIRRFHISTGIDAHPHYTTVSECN